MIVKNRKVYQTIVIASIIVLIILLMYIFGRIYNVSRENKVYSASMKIGQQTKDLDYILQQSIVELELSANVIEDMISNGDTNQDILEYITIESTKMATIFEGNGTGLYGYINGEYIDGVGWIPDEDYNPKERPWYIEAQQSDGNIVLVDPYYDAQTGAFLISIAKMFEDKESVVSFDVSLYRMNEKVNAIAQESNATILVLTENGIIISSSNHNHIGENIKNNVDPIINEMEKTKEKAKNKDFEFKYNNTRYLVFSKDLQDDWEVLVISKRSNLVASFDTLYIGYFAIFILLVAISIVVIHSLNERRKNAEDSNKLLLSIADIYMSMYKLDLINGKYEEIKENPTIKKIVNSTSKNSLNFTTDVIQELAKDNTKIIETNELFSLLGESDVITKEYESKIGWIRERYIVIERKNDIVQSVLWVLENIDKEKQLEDRLRKELVVDELTGLLNRKAYERKLHSYDQASLEVDLVFISLDVNFLKKANDNYGHLAGDELLKGASECLTKTFGEFGTIYRTGGDEFIAIIHLNNTELEKLIKKFNNDVESWKGKLVDKLSISYGYASANEYDDIKLIQLAKIADDRMYEHKKNYYNTLGLTQRGY